MSRVPAQSAEPPVEMPPARTVRVPGRGEMFLRDSGGAGPAVMLLHGWIASADLNWWGVYGGLIEAGYRVLAIDHRGHGRGLRALVPFRFSDCADDAAAVLRALDATPAVIVGYSMGGAIAQILARDHPETVQGLVLSATARHWQDPRTRLAFKGLGVLGLVLSVAPRSTYRLGLRRSGIVASERSPWLRAELMRHSARDLAEAGRELVRFDSRPWLGSVQAPIAVLLTTRDELVPVTKQRDLAAAARAQVFEAPLAHMEIHWRGHDFSPVLLRAIAAVRAAEAVKAA